MPKGSTDEEKDDGENDKNGDGLYHDVGSYLMEEKRALVDKKTNEPSYPT